MGYFANKQTIKYIVKISQIKWWLIIIFIMLITGCSVKNQNFEISKNSTLTPPEISVVATATTEIQPTPTELHELPDGFVQMEYSLTQYGITFVYPEDWMLSDHNGFLAVSEPESSLTKIFLEAGDTTIFENTDPVVILNQHYEDLALGFLQQGERQIIEEPKAIEVNKQKAAYLTLMKPYPKDDKDIPSIFAFVALVVNDQRFVIIQGVTISNKIEVIQPIFDVIVSSIKVEKPNGPVLIEPNNYYEIRNYDIVRPNFYRLEAKNNQPIGIILQLQENILSSYQLVVYHHDNDYFKQNNRPNENDKLVGFVEQTSAPIGLVFEPETLNEYVISVGTTIPLHGDFAMYVLSSVSDNVAFNTGNLIAEKPFELTFSTKSNKIYPILVQTESNVILNIYNSQNNLLVEIDNKTVSDSKSYVFRPEIEDDYTLQIISNKDTQYISFINEFDHID